MSDRAVFTKAEQDLATDVLIVYLAGHQAGGIPILDEFGNQIGVLHSTNGCAVQAVRSEPAVPRSDDV